MPNDAMQQIIHDLQQLVDANFAYFPLWLAHVLWTWQWWIQLVLCLVSIFGWIALRKRNSTGRLLLVGFFVLSTSMWLDFLGNSFGLWYYPYKLVPTLPPFFPWESTIPAEILLILQYKPTLSPWVKAIFLGVLNAFILEPIAVKMGLYVMVHWSYFFSFPIYVVLYLVSHHLAHLDTFKRLDEA